MFIDVYGDTLCARVAAACLASTGHQVLAHVAQPQSPESYASEPGLAQMLQSQQRAGRLQWCEFGQPPAASAVIWLALAPGDVLQAESILRDLPGSDGRWLVVNQSNFPVGTSESLTALLNGAGELVCLPDLLVEGSALNSFQRPDQWLLGSDSEQAQVLVRELLRPFNRLRDVIQPMSLREAEFTKLAIVGMLATRLSYMNDMANLADTLGVDIEQVRRGMGADPRIGEAYLYPGCGFGGQAFSRDVMRLADTVKDQGLGGQLLQQVLHINELQKELLFRKLWRHYGTRLQGRRVAIWGAAFKPGTARIDNAPVLRLLDALWAQGVQVHVHDPQALPTLAEWTGPRDDLVLHDDPYAAAEQADALLLLTEWKQYWSPDFLRLLQIMRSPLLLDGRNIWNPQFVRQQGFEYYGVGRG